MNRTKVMISVICAGVEPDGVHCDVRATTSRYWAHVQRIKTRVGTAALKPELVTKKDLDVALAIVTLGCDLPGSEAVIGKLVEWNDIPSVSQNFEAARDDIVKRVQGLN